MSTPVITVSGLGKRYRIGGLRRQADTFRDSLVEAAASAWQGAKSILTGGAPGGGTEDFWALRDVSFEVGQGEVVGIIGRNGAGKSTLLKILSRITEPTEGRAILRGRIGSLLEVGTGFHPELTGRDNIYLSGAILGMKKAEIDKKFDEIVEFSGVEKFLDTPAKHYSSGMYVRLGFAVAAHLDPEILIVDEVLAVGDAEFQKKCLGKMGDVAKSGRTVLFVSHNMAAVQALCGRSILLEAGKIAADGDTAEVMNKYLSTSVAGSDAVVNLATVPRSAGSEKAILDVWLENDQGQVITEAMMGRPLRICFRFKTQKSLTKSCAFGFAIDTQAAQRVFSLSNQFTGDDVPPGLAEGVARFDVPELPLLPGRYSISVAIIEDSLTILDYVEQSLPLFVSPADIYGSGKIPASYQGVIYVRGKVHVGP